MRPDYPEAHTNLGLTWRSLGDNAAALPHLEEAARLQPDSPGIEFNLAELLADLQRLPEAVGYYERAARLSPGSLELELHPRSGLCACQSVAGRPGRIGVFAGARALERPAAGRREIEAAIDATRARLKR